MGDIYALEGKRYDWSFEKFLVFLIVVATAYYEVRLFSVM